MEAERFGGEKVVNQRSLSYLVVQEVTPGSSVSLRGIFDPPLPPPLLCCFGFFSPSSLYLLRVALCFLRVALLASVLSPCPSLCVGGGGVSCVALRAQLGRLGGSRWGWVLQIKCRAITNKRSLTQAHSEGS